MLGQIKTQKVKDDALRRLLFFKNIKPFEGLRPATRFCGAFNR